MPQHTYAHSRAHARTHARMYTYKLSDSSSQTCRHKHKIPSTDHQPQTIRDTSSTQTTGRRLSNTQEQKGKTKENNQIQTMRP
eukprot:gene9383-1631_t